MIVVNQREKEINEYLLEIMPDVMYHGTAELKYCKKDFIKKIRIFNSLNDYNKYEDKYGRVKVHGRELPRRSFGRTNLDSAYHGLYLTPNYDEAYKWATKIIDEPGQIIKIKINKDKILEEGCLSYCFPNYEWIEFIVNNRKRKTIKNDVSISYTLRADSKMNIMNDKIQRIESKADIIDVFQDVIDIRLKKYQTAGLDWDYDSFLKDIDIISGKYFQLCISNSNFLKFIEVIDIINIEKEDSYEQY